MLTTLNDCESYITEYQLIERCKVTIYRDECNTLLTKVLRSAKRCAIVALDFRFLDEWLDNDFG
jgi:hypothetical protein